MTKISNISKLFILVSFLSGALGGLVVYLLFPSPLPPQLSVTTQREVVRFVMRPPFVVGECIQEETWESVFEVLEVGKQQFLTKVVKESKTSSLYDLGKENDLPFSLAEYYSIVECP